MKRFYINPDYAGLLSRAGLDDFAMLSSGELPGEVISREDGRNSRRLDLEGQQFYLKRVSKMRPGKALESLLKLEIPHHYSWREMQQVQSLKKAGIRCMNVAAAGESTRWGVPAESFILVQGVYGPPLDQVVSALEETGRASVVKRLGTLTASLHSSGFFTQVRMKDIICDDDGEFVLIDREGRHPHPVKFTPKRASDSLYRMTYRQLRDGLSWTDNDWSAYFDGYREAIGSRWRVSEEDLRKICKL